jgi:predicted AlkP superfamily phosphohydrolase/phosphomutase
VARVKVTILGIDALNFKVLDPLIDEGIMPNFKRLKELSAHSKMDSIIPSVTGPAWTTINTGKNPGKHGIFDFVRMEDGELKVNSPSRIDSETFIETLTRMGKRCIVVGVPYTYPPRRTFNGIAISDFLHPKVEIYPPDKASAIAGYRAIADVGNLEGVDLARDLIALTVKQAEVGRTLHSEEDWDLFYFYIPAIDTYFHHFYHFIGKDGPEWSAGKELFREVDTFLGYLMDRIGDGYLFIVSDHGFRLYPETVYLNRILESEGLMVRSYALSKGSARSSKGIKATVARIVKTPFIFPIARAIYRLFKRIIGGNKSEVKIALEEGIDYASSACFTPTTETMGVYLTDRGKPNREGIISLLNGLDHGGRKVFDRVIPREQLYDGPHTGEAPDLLLYSERFMVNANIYGRDRFGPETAYHDMEASFFIMGKGVKAGLMDQRPKLTDIAPTVLRLFGISPPEDMDGRFLESAFTEPPGAGSTELDRIRKAALKFKGKGPQSR